MAEALLKKLIQEENLDLDVRSAGVATMDGLSASAQAIQVLQEKGIKHDHRSRMLNKDLVEWADLILTMTFQHKQLIVQEFPEYMEKVYTLKEYASLDQNLEKLYRSLDQIYVKMESKRAEVQARYKLKADEKWPKEAEEDLLKEWKKLQEKEKHILDQIHSHSMDFDIQDPFGGSVEIYRSCANELEEWIRKALIKIKRV